MTDANEARPARGISRRRLLGVSGAVGLSAVLLSPGRAMAQSTASGSGPLPQALGVLGADFNQDLASVDVRQLKAAGSNWVRGFYPVTNADNGDMADDPNIQAILAVAKQGYGTVLTLKFPYSNTPMPAPGTPAMAAALAELDKILPAVMGQVDILEIGNEPYNESRAQDKGTPLNVFYEAVAQYVIAYRQAHGGSGSKTRLYMGALNRLDLAARQTPGTARWMAFAAQTPEIDGVDIHPHVPSADAVQPFLDYILPKMRADQTFLVTEFSLVWYWQAHLTDQISATWAAQYGFDPASLVWQVIAASIANPFTQTQWNDFLSASPWFTSQKHFMTDQMKRFRGTGRLAVATYGFQQDVPMTQNFNATKPPWVLNSIFDTYTVQTQPNGLPGHNDVWYESFRDLQHS